MEENLYFAYGSNLDLEQMAQRCPDAEIVGPVRLENYELRFRGSGFATVAPKKGSTVHGLVWKITPNCEQSLDMVASASIHGHTRAAAHILAEKLRAKGAKVVEIDLTRTDVSYAVTEAFRCGKTVLACATYDGFLFPPMENLLAHLKTKAFQSRTIALMENGTWAPMAAKLMRAELDGMKNITVCDTVVTLRSASNAAAEAQMDALVDELLSK